MTQSLFQPCITVFDDETIDIDWSDSYVNTVLDDETIVYDEPEGQPHSAGILDPLIAPAPVTGAGPTTAQQVAILRRLADYMEEHPRPT